MAKIEKLTKITRVISYAIVFGLGAYVGDSYNIKNRFVDILHPNTPVSVKTYPYIHDLSLELRIIDNEKFLFLEDKKHNVYFRVNRDGSAGTPEEQIKRRIINGFDRLKKSMKHNIEDFVSNSIELKDKAYIVYKSINKKIKTSADKISDIIKQYIHRDKR